MARFYVGQRVRVKWVSPGCNPSWSGAAVTIISLGIVDPLYPKHNVIVRDDGGIEILGCTDQLEPLQPEGWQTVEWSDCLWQPPKVTA